MQKKSFRIYVVISLVFSLIILLMGSSFSYMGINEKIVIEAGSEFPKASAFLKDSRDNAKYITEIRQLNSSQPGIYDIIIDTGGRKYKVKLEIQDTTAPKAQIKNVDLYESRVVEPHEFIDYITDATDVTVAYKVGPDYSLTGNQNIVLMLKDTSGNKSEYSTKLRISKTKATGTFDISGEKLDVGIFLKDPKDLNKAFLIDTGFTPDELGTFPIQVNIDNIIYDSSVEIIDIIPPNATAVDRTFWQNDEFTAADFVTEIVDATNVTVDYLEEPDLTCTVDQKVKILLTDQANNQSIIEANLTLISDTEPPIIYGAEDRTVLLNKPVAYKKGVYAVDNRDTDIEVSVDSSRVNTRKEGYYNVIYSATDSSGNTTQEEVIFQVIAYTAEHEEVDKLADEILSRIITDNMTLKEKALAIYKYVNKNVYYIGVSHNTDIITEAYYGLLKTPGDCYTYFAVCDLLLNKVNIPNIRVERLKYEGDTNHYWHMINCGEGWYHFDACIHKPAFFSFMLTDAQAEAYSRKRGNNGCYYRHDKDKYPTTPAN